MHWFLLIIVTGLVSDVKNDSYVQIFTGKEKCTETILFIRNNFNQKKNRKITFECHLFQTEKVEGK